MLIGLLVGGLKKKNMNFSKFDIDLGWLLRARRNNETYNLGVTFVRLFGGRLQIDHQFYKESGTIFIFSIRHIEYSYFKIRTPRNTIGFQWGDPVKWRE